MERRYGGKCRSGKHELTLENTYVSPTGKHTCLECKHTNKNNDQLRRLYGIESVEHRDAILASQGNACAICRRTDCHWGRGFMNTWHIDHDPARPGTYRGILCASCNTALGRLERLLPAVIDYLRVEQRASQIVKAT